MPTASDLRRSVAELNRLAATDLEALWRQVTTADEARAALLDILPALVDVYGSAAGTVAADWYDDLRDELNVSRRFFAIVAEIDDTGTDVLARWGIEPLFKVEPDWGAARTLIDGGLQRRIADVARNTVRTSALEDPSADGWQRVGDGKSCAFCSMLIARGAVYSDTTADFASHDHCNCAAAPAFTGYERPVKPYTPSSRNISDADRARVREYLATHDVG